MADEIEGPLGLWPWPVLNTLIKINGDSNNSSGVEQAKLIRDSQGEVQEIIVIKE